MKTTKATDLARDSSVLCESGWGVVLRRALVEIRLID